MFPLKRLLEILEVRIMLYLNGHGEWFTFQMDHYLITRNPKGSIWSAKQL